MGKNYLFVMAIDKYSDSKILPLNNAVHDATKLIEILTQKYSYELITDSLFDENGTRKRVIEELNKISYLVTKEDTLIIYFAGHGELNPLTKKGYWIPSDAENSISDFIPNSTVVDILSGIDIKHLLLIIDSCFSGSFLNQMRSNSEFHYRKLDNSKSRWVICSGSAEKVSDGAAGIGSPFSIILTEFLSKNSEVTFSVGELAVAISKGVGSTSNQQPQFGFVNELGHEGGQMVFNLDKISNQDVFNSQDPLNKIVISYEIATMLKENGVPQESIFGYYTVGDRTILKRNDASKNFDSAAFTYEELAEFIPDEIEVDRNTYLAGTKDYYELGDAEEGTYDIAVVTFQRVEVLGTPFMAICKCRGRMVAFSKTDDGLYKNLIAWGRNQAESAGIMWKMLRDELKV